MRMKIDHASIYIRASSDHFQGLSSRYLKMVLRNMITVIPINMSTDASSVAFSTHAGKTSRILIMNLTTSVPPGIQSGNCTYDPARSS
jgi:hypothetical protein